MTGDRQRGSAAVEFVGVSALVTACALGILQVGMIAHVSAVLTDSANAGAAYAALADSSLAAGAARARELAHLGVARDLVEASSAATATVVGRPVAVVTIRYRIPALGTWFPTVSATATGRAFIELP